MKVIVLGAGVLGVTSAWYLAKAGHEVTVIDRQEGPALETSFANGGQISVSHAEPWSNPHAPMRALRWMGREDAPLLPWLYAIARYKLADAFRRRRTAIHLPIEDWQDQLAAPEADPGAARDSAALIGSAR